MVVPGLWSCVIREPLGMQVNDELKRMEMTPLQDTEFVSARLYTGPCFVKYNNTLLELNLDPAARRPCLGELVPALLQQAPQLGWQVRRERGAPVRVHDLE